MTSLKDHLEEHPHDVSIIGTGLRFEFMKFIAVTMISVVVAYLATQEAVNRRIGSLETALGRVETKQIENNSEQQRRLDRIETALERIREKK